MAGAAREGRLESLMACLKSEPDSLDRTDQLTLVSVAAQARRHYVHAQPVS
jgi:hypothetical protein